MGSLTNVKKETADIVFYVTDDLKTIINIIFEEDTFWVSQKQMAELFDVEINTVNYHLKEIFKNGELDENATIRKFRIVQKEGSREVAREPLFYSLDAVISVGYRINSEKATKFRIWATKTLKEFKYDFDKLPKNILKKEKNKTWKYLELMLKNVLQKF